MANLLPLLWILLVSFIALFQSSTAVAYNVVRFGARPDGRSDSTTAFSRTFAAACNSRSPSMVYVPRGRYVLRHIEFNGPCRSKIVFKIDGTIVAPSDYRSLGSTGYWIVFRKLYGLGIYGGVFDARGADYWACRKSGRVCPTAARSISIMGSRNVVVTGLTSINSRYFHISIGYCTNMILQYLKLIAPTSSPNTDGIHIQSSTGIRVSHSLITTGDDCVSLGQGAKDIRIERIACGPGHGISIGSLGNFANEPGVENIVVTGSVFTGTQNGFRIKTWARPSNGFVKNVSFRNSVMRNVRNPILIDQNYCPHNRGCPRQSSGVKITGVRISNIRGTSASEVAMKFDCSPSRPCTGIRLENIRLPYINRSKVTASYCKNARGSNRGTIVPRSCLR